jgi:hypothetical protein
VEGDDDSSSSQSTGQTVSWDIRQNNGRHSGGGGAVAGIFNHQGPSLGDSLETFSTVVFKIFVLDLGAINDVGTWLVSEIG